MLSWSQSDNWSISSICRVWLLCVFIAHSCLVPCFLVCLSCYSLTLKNYFGDFFETFLQWWFEFVFSGNLGALPDWVIFKLTSQPKVFLVTQVLWIWAANLCELWLVAISSQGFCTPSPPVLRQLSWESGMGVVKQDKFTASWLTLTRGFNPSGEPWDLWQFQGLDFTCIWAQLFFILYIVSPSYFY